jgi:UTP--glucose-1-phosphate uridylyltransferase
MVAKGSLLLNQVRLVNKTVRKAVIPAAGFGTRFLPATKSMPKEMLPIIDKPAIHYAVEEAVRAGIEEIIFITGRGKRAIEDYFDHSYELEDLLEIKGKTELLAQVRQISDMADIVYIRQKEALGLGHAVLRARDWVGDEPFAVILPDVLIDSKESCTKQLIKVYEKTGKSVVGVKEVLPEQVSSYGIVDPESKGSSFNIRGVVEKPTLEEAPSNLSIVGRYIFTPEIFKYLAETKPCENGEIQLTDAIEKLIKGEGVCGATFEGDNYDTGDKLGFLKATVSLALKHEELGEEFRKYLNEL